MTLKRWLTNPLFLTIWCMAASFGTYACMYGFRKPFTAATYDTDPFEPGVKASLVAAQVFGYMLSKFIGIKVISEMTAERRAVVLLGLIGLAELALVAFGLVPQPFKIVCLFLNGLPLGMVYGLVAGFLEGRRLTEAFVAGLCASFIFASGFVKSVGAWLLQSGISETWMPAIAGLIFLLPLLLFVGMLAQIPHPTEADVIHRAPREPMTRSDRLAWIQRHGLGLGCIIVGFLLITILRTLRDDFAVELWTALGTEGEPDIFAKSETIVAVAVTLLSGLVVIIQNNHRALLTSLAMGIVGFGIVAFALIGLQNGTLSGFLFMVLTGLGLYLPYVVVHTTVFERLVALTRDKGNMAFLMYLADTVGYLGYVILMYAGGLFKSETALLQRYQTICWTVATFGILSFLCAMIVYRRPPKSANKHPEQKVV